MTKFGGGSLRKKGLKQHFAEIGINYEQFGEWLAADLSIQAIIRLIEKRTKHKYVASTVKDWRELYREEQNNDQGVHNGHKDH